MPVESEQSTDTPFTRRFCMFSVEVATKAATSVQPGLRAANRAGEGAPAVPSARWKHAKDPMGTCTLAAGVDPETAPGTH